MGIIQSIKAVLKNREVLCNPVKLFKNAKKYIIVLPDDEFFLYLFLEPLLNIGKELTDKGKRVMFLINGDLIWSPELFTGNVMRVNLQSKSNISVVKSELSENYRGACYISCNFPGNILDKQFRTLIRPSVTVSIGSEMSDFNISIVYNGHYEEFAKSIYGFLCIRRKSIGGFFKIRKLTGSGIGINKELFSEYRGEKIVKPSIIDNNPTISTLELGKLINKSRYIVSYKDRIAAIAYLLKKKVVCITNETGKLPKGMDYCHGLGGEIDYFIE
ncbi:MAG TPA: hypothetical protein ENJ25_02100 [Firmicutes bacterium]|uniref:Uncharacterized protein n=1 Tax=candidate division TA06 bacterium TaxID=2250710 RepID=A0A660S8Q7_UNCT6|nr:MAG: hypothetical protein DRP44_05535 [candidate division TA06 bacterium]HFD04917.1 hypothetical protein [Bacillota bacterium]